MLFAHADILSKSWPWHRGVVVLQVHAVNGKGQSDVHGLAFHSFSVLFDFVFPTIPARVSGLSGFP